LGERRASAAPISLN